MELDDLNALLLLSEHGSVRGAAQKLGLDRSMLRRRLARLEVAFGTPLVIREGNGLRFTAAGVRAVDRARVVLSDVGSMMADVQSASGSAAGVFRMLVPLGIPPALRVRGLPWLLDRHPDLRLDIRELPDPLQGVHLPFDVMVHFGACPPMLNLISSVLTRTERVLVASPAYLEANGVPTNMADLQPHRLLMWRCPGQPESSLPRTDGSTTPVEPWVVASDASVICEAVARGLGIGCLPAVLADASMTRVLADEVREPLPIRVSSHTGSRVDARVAALLTNLHELVASVGDA